MRTAILGALLLALAIPASAQTGAASVQFDDQTIEGQTVVVQQATLSNGGFVVIHASENGTPGAIRGVSGYLGIGTHDDIEINVSFDMGMQDNVTLIAMAHFDSNDNEEFDFATSNGTDDGPYQDGGVAITDSANVQRSGETVGAGRDNGTAENDDTPGFAVVAVIAALAAVVLVRRRS